MLEGQALLSSSGARGCTSELYGSPLIILLSLGLLICRRLLCTLSPILPPVWPGKSLNMSSIPFLRKRKIFCALNYFRLELAQASLGHLLSAPAAKVFHLLLRNLPRWNHKWSQHLLPCSRLKAILLIPLRPLLILLLLRLLKPLSLRKASLRKGLPLSLLLHP